jgi:hypothetical protein
LSVALGETPRQRIFGKGIINGVVYDFLRIEKFHSTPRNALFAVR